MWACENPILRQWIRTRETPVVKSFRKPEIERYRITACLRLAIADALHGNGACDGDLGLVKINVIPLQRQQLADAQPRELIEEDRRARRLPQQAEQRGNLLNCSYNRDLRPLRTLANIRRLSSL